MGTKGLPEPWLRGTLTEVPPVHRAVLHALELAKEDLTKWCGELSDEELNRHVGAIAPVAFQLRHIPRSADRLLTYAEGQALSQEQLAALRAELDAGAKREELLEELTTTLARCEERIRKLAGQSLNEARSVGLKKLPTTLGGLLVHVADHTQRHVGQAITTAKLVVGRKD